MAFMHEFPHTNNFDSDLREILEMYLTVKDLPKTWETYKQMMDTEFAELKAFVNDYFDNLNVQNEINNKIDSMVKDGTMNNIIRTFFNECEQQIAVLEERMDTFTSLKEGSTTGDAELHDGRTDYTGKTWGNIGSHIRGVTSELSSEIDGVKSDLANLSHLDFEITDGKYVDIRTIDGNIADNAYYCVAKDVDVHNIDTITIPVFFATGAGCATYAKNGNVIRKFNNTDESLTGKTLTIKLSDDEYYFSSSCRLSDKNSFYIAAKNYRDYVNSIDEMVLIDGNFVMSNGNFSDNTGFCRTDYINLNVYSLEYIRNFVNHENVCAISFFDETKNFISGVTNDAFSVEIPDGAYFLILSFRKSTLDNQYVKLTKKIKTNIDLSNKFIVGFGDSIMRGDGNNHVGIPDIISNMYKCSFKNYAKGGATICVVDDNTNNVVNQFNTLSNDISRADIILVNGLANDAYNLTTIGTITEGYDEIFDTHTFCGAFEWIIKTLVTKYNKSSHIYIRVHKMKSRTVQAQETYGNLAIQICKKWGIPIVDLYEDCSLNTWIPSLCLKYTYDSYGTGLGDGTHPNELGYKHYYIPRIVAKINDLMN